MKKVITESSWAEINHNFMANCAGFDGPYETLSTLVKVYFALSLIWIFLVWFYEASDSTDMLYAFMGQFCPGYFNRGVMRAAQVDDTLLRFLTLLPVVKTIRVNALSNFFAGCPWEGDSIEHRNFAMMSVTISTVYETCLAIILIYLSKGWLLTPEGSQNGGAFDMSGPETANLSLIIGFLYLMNCAQFLTIDFFWPALIVNLSLVMLQISIFWLAIRNSLKALKLIKREQQIVYEMNFRPLMEAATLKFHMMRQYVIVITGYFFYKISIRGSYDLR